MKIIEGLSVLAEKELEDAGQLRLPLAYVAPWEGRSARVLTKVAERFRLKPLTGAGSARM